MRVEEKKKARSWMKVNTDMMRNKRLHFSQTFEKCVIIQRQIRSLLMSNISHLSNNTLVTGHGNHYVESIRAITTTTTTTTVDLKSFLNCFVRTFFFIVNFPRKGSHQDPFLSRLTSCFKI